MQGSSRATRCSPRDALPERLAARLRHEIMAGMGWLTIVLGLTCICAAYGQIGCKSADGAPVDW